MGVWSDLIRFARWVVSLEAPPRTCAVPGGVRYGVEEAYTDRRFPKSRGWFAGIRTRRTGRQREAECSADTRSEAKRGVRACPSPW